jgi:4-hydroxybenzoate polyprenyltransferase
MLLLQFAVGAANDLADAPRDAVSRPSKPIPAGMIRPVEALAIASGCAVAGIGLAASRGLATVALAAAGLGIGLAYDLRLKATPWSWLPFAAGIPLIPLFAWVGATGSIPPAVLCLALLAAPAGAGLAVANALADIEGDRSAGTRTVATALGETVAWRTASALLVGTWLAAVGALVVLGAGPGQPSPPGDSLGPTAWAADVAWPAIAISGALLVLGAWTGLGPAAARRRLGWGIEGIAVALLAAGWVAAVTAAGGT